GRGTKAGHLERTEQLELVDAVRAVLAAAWSELLDLVVGLGEALAAESDADFVRPGGSLKLDVLQAGVYLIHGPALHLIVKLVVLLAADDCVVNDLVVHRHDERILVLHAVAPDVVGHVGDVDAVLAIGGKVDFGEDASAGTERQAGDMRQLVA